MVDVFMVIMIIVLIIVILAASFYLIVYFSHPDDNGFGSGLLCKIVGVLGLLIACSQIFFLPVDVGNNRGSVMNFPMDTIWKIVYICILLFSFVIIPLMTAIYEVDPDYPFCKKIFHGFCFFFVEVFVIAALFCITYLFFGLTNVPAQSVQCGIELYQMSNEGINLDLLSKCKTKSKILEVSVSLIIYSIGLMSFISYFLFTVFGGIGLIAMPMDMIYAFCTKPKKLTPPVLEALKKEVVETAYDLKDLANEIKKLENDNVHQQSFFSKAKRDYNLKVKQLKVGVTVLEQQYDVIDMQKLLSGQGVIMYYVNLVLGIILFIFTIIWIIQIVVYLIIKVHGKPLYGFLNIPLVHLTDKGISFIAVAIFAVLCAYLLLASMKGNLKFGLRFPLLGAVHEMKKNETYMNSILFNIMLMMITSVSVTQFCVKCFHEYTSMTDLDIIFNTLIKYLNFFQYFFKYNIFEYAICIIMVISFVYLACRPNDANTVKKILYEKLENDKTQVDTSKEKMIEMNECIN